MRADIIVADAFSFSSVSDERFASFIVCNRIRVYCDSYATWILSHTRNNGGLRVMQARG